jgi:hypothetical protein
LLPICPVYENLASLPSVNVRLIFVLSGVACILIVAGAYGLVLVHFRIAELELAISVLASEVKESASPALIADLAEQNIPPLYRVGVQSFPRFISILIP